MSGYMDGYVRNGDSERIPGGDDIGGPVQQSSSQPIAVGAPPARPRDMVSLARQEYWK